MGQSQPTESFCGRSERWSRSLKEATDCRLAVERPLALTSAMTEMEEPRHVG